MKCPTCPDTRLVMSERQGVEIDYCPHCRGVWLDRGELDKLLERAAAQSASPTSSIRHEQSHGNEYRSKDDENAYHRQKPYYKHKSWLSEIFD